MDLYQLLGLSRIASEGEIERAYRRLARRYHPGINPGDRVAEEMYRQIQQAYDILADRERRREYDQGGVPAGAVEVRATVAFEGFSVTPADASAEATFSELFADVFHDAARRATTPEAGDSIATTLSVSFEDALRGGEFPLSVTRQARCESCGGDGRLSRRPAACPVCGGQGTRRWARGHMVFTASCDTCGGRGHIVSQPCRTCGGVGVHPRTEVVRVVVPAGVESGARIVVPGRGHAASRDDGGSGDLHVTVQVSPHRFFRRDGRDLRLTLPVAVHEAGLGAEVDVPTLDGPVRLSIPPGTPAGQQFRLRGQGALAWSGRAHDEAGDLIVEIAIALPPITDDRSRQLLREFGRLNSHHDVRGHLFDR